MQDWSWVTDDELHVPQKWFPSFDFQEFPKRLKTQVLTAGLTSDGTLHTLDAIYIHIHVYRNLTITVIGYMREMSLFTSDHEMSLFISGNETTCCWVPHPCTCTCMCKSENF